MKQAVSNYAAHRNFICVWAKWVEANKVVYPRKQDADLPAPAPCFRGILSNSVSQGEHLMRPPQTFHQIPVGTQENPCTG
jgi:hypothetical protein